MNIKIEHQAQAAQLDAMGVKSWPIWTQEVSEFPWHYSESETCYFLEGEVTVVPESGEPVTVGQGDLVTFPAGLSCTWKISQPVRKHYQFG